jgi:hypothetical protein
MASPARAVLVLLETPTAAAAAAVSAARRQLTTAEQADKGLETVGLELAGVGEAPEEAEEAEVGTPAAVVASGVSPAKAAPLSPLPS